MDTNERQLVVGVGPQFWLNQGSEVGIVAFNVGRDVAIDIFMTLQDFKTRCDEFPNSFGYDELAELTYLLDATLVTHTGELVSLGNLKRLLPERILRGVEGHYTGPPLAQLTFWEWCPEEEPRWVEPQPRAILLWGTWPMMQCISGSTLRHLSVRMSWVGASIQMGAILKVLADPLNGNLDGGLFVADSSGTYPI